MAEISKQGIVDVTGTTLYTVPYKQRARAVTITATNAAPYILTLSKYDKSSDTTVTVFTYSLDAGDSVIDQTGYYLEDGDQLILISSVPGTNYTAHFIGLSDGTNR